LRREFHEQCVYCRKADRGNREFFGIDHFRPKSLFPQLAVSYTNLFYACNPCNARKGDYWPDDEHEHAGMFIPNPCDHVMFEHLRYVDGTTQPKSRTGQFTIARLDLNDPAAVRSRLADEQAINAMLVLRDNYVQTLSKLNAMQSAASAVANGLLGDIDRLERELKALDDALRLYVPLWTPR
jgi:HNH endonuclease